MNLYNLPVAMKDIREAEKTLKGKVYKSGMPRSNYLSEQCQGNIFLKFENMQRTGSFKMRGAFNKLSSLTPEERSKGIVACSAGNHAQGVSLSCSMLGIDGKIVMPTKAPVSKVDATKGYGAEVILYGENFNDTMQKVQEIVEQEGRIFIHPFNDTKVIAGQGTIGLEILQDLWDVDNVVIPIGGGGLISGIAIALKSFNPNINIFGVQTENVHGMAASFRSGKIESHRIDGTIADGCDVALPGTLNFEIVKSLVNDIILVSEEEIRKSMLALIQYNKIVTEGAGALATAALLSRKLNKYIKGTNTVSIISGGNIDLSRISETITSFK